MGALTRSGSSLTSSYSNWDFYNYHVQQELAGGQFVSAETTLIAAGSPIIDTSLKGASTTETGNVYPIGLIESIGLQQSKQLQRIFEIGSSRSYFIPGRVVGAVNLGRTFYFGPSLLRALYAYYRSEGNGIQIGTEDAGAGIDSDEGLILDPKAALLDIYNVGDMHTLRKDPGFGYFFIDLASDLFNQPTGMAMYFKDANSLSLGGLYLEQCYVQGHQLNISSGSVLIMEGASLQYDRLVPIKLMTE